MRPVLDEPPEIRRPSAGQAVLRYVVGLAWSLGVGLSGAWLMLVPWAVGGQSASGWTSATTSQFWTGVGLVVLALAGSVLVALDVRAVVRVRRPRPARATPATGDDLERTLIDLARRLTEGLEASRSAPPPPVDAALTNGRGLRREP